MRHGWNHTHVSDECKVPIAESDKLKRQHEAGSKESRGKTREDYKKVSFSKKDLHALIDERIGSKKSQGFAFDTLKNAKKYIEKHQNKIESDSDSFDSN